LTEEGTVSHSYDHSHGHSGYSLEQLCTVAVCGALGVVVVLLYFQRTEDNQKVLTFMLANYLHPYVLGSGIAILAIVALFHHVDQIEKIMISEKLNLMAIEEHTYFLHD